MAGSTGLEPAASAVTGQRSNQLNYDPACADGDMHRRCPAFRAHHHYKCSVTDLVGSAGLEPATFSV
jgi:hypothetical protein